MSKAILVYHSMGNDDLFLQVPLDHFKDQIEFVIKKYHPQKLSPFFTQKSNNNEVLIMFDDAFHNAILAMD